MTPRPIERIPACTVSYCPAPTSPEWHKCWVCGALATEHHHVKPRGMGGSKSRKKDPKNIVALCHPHHEMVTTGGWGCSINHVPGRGLVFWAWDLHGETKAERVLEAESSAVEGAEAGDSCQTGTLGRNQPVIPSAAPPSVSGRPIATSRSQKRRLTAQGADFIDQSPGVGSAAADRARAGDSGRLPISPALGGGDALNRPPRQSAAAPPASKAESAAAKTGMVKVRDGQSAGSVQATGPAALNADVPEGLNVSAAAPSALVIPGTMTETSLTLPQNLSFEDWSDGVKKLSEFGHHYQFFLGDAIIFGEDRFGEEAWQTLDCLGLQPESIGNIVRVCRATPPPSRHGALKYSHHVVTYKLPPEERDKWLDVAEANQWSIREFRESVQGKPSRKKRWSLEELRGWAHKYGTPRQREILLAWIDWLEDQGE